MVDEGQLGDWLSADQVLLDDALQVGFVAAAVPDALGIHEGDRAIDADPQAIDLRAVDRALDVDHAQLLQSTLEEGPARELLLARSAIAPDTQQNVAAVVSQVQLGGHPLQPQRASVVVPVRHGPRVYCDSVRSLPPARISNSEGREGWEARGRLVRIEQQSTAESAALVLAICHEVGNLVGVIRLSAHMLDDQISPVALAAASCDIDDLSARIGALLGLVRPVVADDVPDEGALPRAVLAGLRSELDAYGGRGVDLVIDECADLPEVCGSPEMLHHLLTTLVYYAVEAARPRGRVRVRVERAGATEGKTVVFGIEDDGPEDEELRAWQTQPIRGRTLGCVLSSRALERVGGSLQVTRSNGRTTTKLTLPFRDTAPKV